MPTNHKNMTPEQREYREKNRDKIKAQQREWNIKNKGPKRKQKKRKSRTLTRAENRNDMRAIIAKRPTVNMRDTMHLSPEKFLKAAKQYCRENL